MRRTAMMKCCDVGPFLDHVPAALALEDVGDLLQHLRPELAALEILVAERDAEAQDGSARVVDVLVQLLRPQSHPRASVGRRGHQRRLRIGLLEVLEDHVRIPE